MKRPLTLLLVLAAAPAFAQYYGAPSGGMGAMPTMPPAPPPGPPPSYDYYGGGDMSYDSSGYSSAPSGNSSFATSSPGILSYGFLEGGYQYRDPKNNGLEGAHGLGLTLSAQLFQPLFIKAGFDWSKSSGGGRASREYDFTNASLGVGLYLPIVSRFHFVGEVGGIYSKLDASRNNLSFTEGAFYARPALRFAITEAIELQAGITITSADNYDTSIIDFSAYFRVLSQLDLSVGVDLGDEFTGFAGGIRFRW